LCITCGQPISRNPVIAENIGPDVPAQRVAWEHSMQVGAQFGHVSRPQLGENAAVSTAQAAATLDAFLAGAERRAFLIAQMATHDRDEALDLVQDAMLQLARRYGGRPSDEWPPLFYRILENRIRDWQRRQTTRRRLFLMPKLTPNDDNERPDPALLVADGAPDAPQRMMQDAAMAALEPAIAALPTRQKEAFVLRVWEGLSVEDTAAAMGCSDGSVKTHLSRALNALRTRLAGVWP
jgi:RNA polymerase sigma-70 factor, ECF subfamily